MADNPWYHEKSKENEPEVLENHGSLYRTAFGTFLGSLRQ